MLRVERQAHSQHRLDLRTCVRWHPAGLLSGSIRPAASASSQDSRIGRCLQVVESIVVSWSVSHNGYYVNLAH